MVILKPDELGEAIMNILQWFRSLPAVYSEMFAVVVPLLQTPHIAAVLYIGLLVYPSLRQLS